MEDPKEIARRFARIMQRACDGTKAGKDHVKVRVADWHALMDLAVKAVGATTPTRGDQSHD